MPETIAQHPKTRLLADAAVVAALAQARIDQAAYLAVVADTRDAAHQVAVNLRLPTANTLAESADALLAAAVTKLDGLEAEAVAAETALFASYNLTREQTGIFRRVAGVRLEVNAMRDGITSDRALPLPPNPTDSAFANVLDWFTA